MKQLTREQEILRQVKLAKESQFGVTAVKVELEAVFNRRYMNSLASRCSACDSAGRMRHELCSGRGRIDDAFCAGCNGEGIQRCDSCFAAHIAWGSEVYIQQWLLRRMEPWGLSKREDDGTYVPAGALIFGYCYYDVSVDTEFTFTLSLEDPQSIFLLPKIIGLWKELGESIGNAISVSNAGMHMAFLKTEDFTYPVPVSEIAAVKAKDAPYLANMEKSMRLLQPALFFLAAANQSSRSLHFRVPRVSAEKYSSIHYSGGALEFRVFETCYDEPERVLDNFVVMRNCLRFWSKTYRDPNLKRICSNVKFGNDNDETLARLYKTSKHIDLLNAGIVKLKPAYYTVAELKKQRDFKTTRRVFTQALRKVKQNALKAYPQEKRRREWLAEVAFAEQYYYSLSRIMPLDETSWDTATHRANEEANSEKMRHLRTVQSEQEFVTDQLHEYERKAEGQFNLVAA